MTTTIPRDPAPDATAALARRGYDFVAERCRRLGTDAFETRLLLRRAVCARGAEAARVFYEPGRFTRNGAVPRPALRLVQDVGSVATLDGAAHARRKRMFVALLMDRAGIARLGDLVEAEWRAGVRRWAARPGATAEVFRDASEVLCRAVCAWSAVPLGPGEAEERTRAFFAMVDGTGSVGLRHLRGAWLRARTERWARSLVRRVRSGDLPAPEGSALRVIAEHRDLDGGLLDEVTAGVELINVLRPTVAVGRYVGFAAIALHTHPEWRERLARGGTEAEYDAFAQEVRRFYPFVPAVAGRALAPFEWRGRRFGRGDLMLLDLTATDRDGRLWDAPDAFRPGRFLGTGAERDPFALVSHGGGGHETGHRCPGEWITVEVTKRAVRGLAEAMRYDVPTGQELGLDPARMPALPRGGGLRIENVAPVGG